MSAPVLTIERASKSFILSHQAIGSLKNLLVFKGRTKREKIDVLRDFSLEVYAGECVALVGRNGAGKSTLLSLISRVYKPSSGSIHVNGKVAPLLELGAGFHPDLTGLENILFNGVILGLTRKEVKERLDDIVAFSELGEYIDAPVRTYSSGMLARLGFSIAVHVDADLLIVDEVLAVGDEAFEQKCYRYIDGFRAKGGAILFVSHQFESIKRVATRAIWLDKGQIKAEGNVDQVLTAYRRDLGTLPEE